MSGKDREASPENVLYGQSKLSLRVLLEKPS
jgi:hypothetical protein